MQATQTVFYGKTDPVIAGLKGNGQTAYLRRGQTFDPASVLPRLSLKKNYFEY